MQLFSFINKEYTQMKVSVLIATLCVATLVVTGCSKEEREEIKSSAKELSDQVKQTSMETMEKTKQLAKEGYEEAKSEPDLKRIESMQAD